MDYLFLNKTFSIIVMLITAQLVYLPSSFGAKLIKNIIKAEDVNEKDISPYKFETFNQKDPAKKPSKLIPENFDHKIVISNKELINRFLMTAKLDLFQIYLQEIYNRKEQVEIKDFLKLKLQESSLLERSLRDRNQNLSEKKISFLYHQLAKKFAGTQPYTDIILSNASKYRSALLRGRAISSLSLDALSNYVDQPVVIEGLIRFVKNREDEQSEMAYQILNKVNVEKLSLPINKKKCLLESLTQLTQN